MSMANEGLFEEECETEIKRGVDCVSKTGLILIGGEAWGPVLGVQASEGHIPICEGSKRG